MSDRSVVHPRRTLFALGTIVLTTGLVLAANPSALPAVAGSQQKIDSRVLREVQGGKSATYWALLRQHANLSAATSIANWNDRGWYVYNRLTSVATSSQRGLRALLTSRGASFTSFWIVNGIRITSNAATLDSWMSM